MEELLLDQSSVNSFEPEYAGFWLRFAALIIDAIILSFPLLTIKYIIFGSIISEESNNLVYNLVNWVVQYIYFAGMESSSNQATLGKMVVGIKVTNMEGEPIDFMNATGRFFAKFISAIILLIGYIMAAFTPKKQALHDQLAKTLVVKK